MLKNRLKYLILFILLLIPIFTFGQNSNPEIKNGVLNLQKWDFKKNGNIRLTGNWEFYWSKFYNYNDFKATTIKPDTYAPVPGVWTNLKINGKSIPNTGFATYRLLIISDTNYSVGTLIFTREIMTAYRVYMDNELISQIGTPGKNSHTADPRVRIDIQSILIHKGVNQLIVQISNYDHRTNAFDEAPLLGEENNIHRAVFKTISFDLIIFGLLVIMAFYHIGLFLLRRKNKVALTFAIFALVLALRTLTTKNFLLSYIFPQTPWNLVYFISYASFYIGLPMFFVYFKQVFEEKRFKWVFIAIYIISGIFLLTLILTPLIYTQLIIFYQAFAVICIIFNIGILIGYIAKKKEGSIILFVSILILSLTVINDMLFFNDYIQTVSLLPYGLFVILLGQALTLGRIFTHAFEQNEILTEKLEVQNQNLEKIVEDRTIKLKERNEELTVTEEELRQTLDELKALNREFEFKNNELNKYFTAIEQSNVAIVITDLSPKIEYVNPYFTTITGYTKEEVLGKNPSILNSGQNTTELYSGLWETIKAGKVWRGEFINRAKDGSNFIEKTIISPIFNSHGEMISYISIKEDITELRKKEREVIEKSEKLEILNIEINNILNDLKSSLVYAQRIQNAVFPSKEELSDVLKDYFLFYKSREIVGGDFYFVRQVDKYKVISVGDCTGHGVPGGFLTILATNLLIEYSDKADNLNPKQILEDLRIEIKTIFSTEKNQIQDGFDIALIILDTQTNQLSYSGANIPAFIYKNNQLIELRPINNPIGVYPQEKNFENQFFQIEKDDILYLATDGTVDQFNKEGVKFTKKRFKEMIEKIAHLDIEEQRNIVENTFREWKTNTRQIDDVTILGIKF